MSSWGSDLPIQFSYGCCWISKEPLELLVQFLQFLHKPCSSFCPTLLHELIKVSPTSRQTKHAQALQPFSLRFTAFLSLPFLPSSLLMGDIINSPFIPITNKSWYTYSCPFSHWFKSLPWLSLLLSFNFYFSSSLTVTLPSDHVYFLSCHVCLFLLYLWYKH